MFSFFSFNKKITVAVLMLLASFGSVAYANHTWGGYHWARTANPFTLKLGDNVSAVWDAHLATTSNDWSLSSVLDTVVTPGQTNPKNCRAVKGRVEVCNSKYGKNGWLGIAQVWVNGSHIMQGVTKLNDTYFNTTIYNTPAWRNLVMCQEGGHTIGLDHQDEDFNNAPLGTCMDYTSDPAPNQHPNQHDYDMLEEIYAHLDVTTTVAQTSADAANSDLDSNEPMSWGKEIKKSSNGKSLLHMRDLGNGHKVFTFVIWAE